MDNQDAQQQVAQSVARRGYRSGWTAPQFLARQVAKLMEELWELSAKVGISHGSNNTPIWMKRIAEAGFLAMVSFDNPDLPWDITEDQIAIDAMKAELADIQVVLFNAAAAIEEATGQPFSVVDAAVAKAQADEARGPR